MDLNDNDEPNISESHTEIPPILLNDLIDRDEPMLTAPNTLNWLFSPPLMKEPPMEKDEPNLPNCLNDKDEAI
jgi:hypothetical protein